VIARYLREDDTHSGLICFFSPRPIERIAKEQQSSGQGETIQGADSMKLGKVDLRDEAQRPFAIAHIPFNLAGALPPLDCLLPLARAQETMQPMAATKRNATEHQPGLWPFPRGHDRWAQRPIQIRRHVRLAPKAACAYGRCTLVNGSGNKENAVPCQFRDPWCPFSQSDMA
jgi:hypothetical protein